MAAGCEAVALDKDGKSEALCRERWRSHHINVCTYITRVTADGSAPFRMSTLYLKEALLPPRCGPSAATSFTVAICAYNATARIHRALDALAASSTRDRGRCS